jgi:superfamily I DNA/RNA helicase
MRNLTIEQEEIVEADDDFMAVTAYAGTGKTTTLRAYAEKRPRDKMLYLAFNKALAEEAKRAFQGCPNVEVRTLHSLAYSFYGYKFQECLGNFRVLDLQKYLLLSGLPNNIGIARVLYDSLNAWTISDQKTIPKFMKKFIPKIGESVAEYNINVKSLVNSVETLWRDMIEGEFVMTHNGYFKLFQLSQPSLNYYKEVLVDEAQDLNDAMINIIFGLKGKKILVGDPYQQIYGWNGAVNALGKAVKVGAKTYYLTQSFRCPKEIASFANDYLKLLGAKKTFRGIEEASKKAPNNYPPIVIARTNASIFDYAARNMGKVRIHYKGGFEGYQFDIIKDINKLRCNIRDSINDPFVRKFKSHEQLDNYVKEAEDTVMKVRLDVERKYGNLVHDIYNKMKYSQAHDENKADIVITTAHKVKGQEYREVLLLDDFVDLGEVISKGIKTKENKLKNHPQTISREEFQLLYVAITRSFERLDVPKRYDITDQSIKQFKDLTKHRCIILV